MPSWPSPSYLEEFPPIIRLRNNVSCLPSLCIIFVRLFYANIHKDRDSFIVQRRWSELLADVCMYSVCVCVCVCMYGWMYVCRIKVRSGIRCIKFSGDSRSMSCSLWGVSILAGGTYWIVLD